MSFDVLILNILLILSKKVSLKDLNGYEKSIQRGRKIAGLIAQNKPGLETHKKNVTERFPL